MALFRHSHRRTAGSTPEHPGSTDQRDAPLYLDVPYSQKDEAKALGARWDAADRRWFVPGGVDPVPFARWLPAHREPEEPVRPAPTAGETVCAAVVGLPRRCYRCNGRTTSVVGVVVPPHLSDDPTGFIDLEWCADAVASAFNDTAERSRHRVGRLRRRTSRLRPEGYIANGCFECDALQGSFPLNEELVECLAEGVEYQDLVIADVQLPLSAIPSWDD